MGYPRGTDLGGDDHLITKRGKRLADQIFVSMRAIDFSRIKEGDALFMGAANQSDAFSSVCRRAIVGADAHASRAQLRDHQVAKFALLQGMSSIKGVVDAMAAVR